jgi:hypothetical protein
MVKKKKNRIKERTKGFRNENTGIDSWESTPMYRNSELSEILGLQSSDQCMTSDEDDFEEYDLAPHDLKCRCGGCIWDLGDYLICGDCHRRYRK